MPTEVNVPRVEGGGTGFVMGEVVGYFVEEVGFGAWAEAEDVDEG